MIKECLNGKDVQEKYGCQHTEFETNQNANVKMTKAVHQRTQSFSHDVLGHCFQFRASNL
jgi:hypothetical protein